VPSLGLSYRRMLLEAKLERLASSVGGAVLEITALLLVLDGLGPVRRSPFLSSFATGFVALARKG